MTAASAIAAIRSNVDSDEALKILRGYAGCGDARIERRLFYPYYHVVANGRLRWLFGERRLKLDCLIDARTGRASSADAPVVEQLEVSESERLVARNDATTAIAAARRYASHALSRGLKVLGNFNLDLRDAELVHRPFSELNESQVSPRGVG